MSRRWTICANCSRVVEIEDEGACDCRFRGDTPKRVEVMPVSEHEAAVGEFEIRIETAWEGIEKLPRYSDDINGEPWKVDIEGVRRVLDACLPRTP